MLWCYSECISTFSLPVLLHTTVVLMRASAFSKVIHFGHSVSTKKDKEKRNVRAWLYSTPVALSGWMECF